VVRALSVVVFRVEPMAGHRMLKYVSLSPCAYWKIAGVQKGTRP
jgi:hypothetical protein